MATQTEGSLMNFAQMLSAPGLDGSGSRGEMGRYRGGLPVPKSLVFMHSGQTNLTLSWVLPWGKPLPLSLCSGSFTPLAQLIH